MGASGGSDPFQDLEKALIVAEDSILGEPWHDEWRLERLATIRTARSSLASLREEWERLQREHAAQANRNRELHKLGAQQRDAMETRAEKAETKMRLHDSARAHAEAELEAIKASHLYEWIERAKKAEAERDELRRERDAWRELGLIEENGQLRAENQRLREALGEIVNGKFDPTSGGFRAGEAGIRQIARQALGEES